MRRGIGAAVAATTIKLRTLPGVERPIDVIDRLGKSARHRFHSKHPDIVASLSGNPTIPPLETLASLGRPAARQNDKGTDSTDSGMNHAEAGTIELPFAFSMESRGDILAGLAAVSIRNAPLEPASLRHDQVKRELRWRNGFSTPKGLPPFNCCRV